MANESELHKLVSKNLLKKLKGSGMNESDFSDFLYEQSMLTQNGGSITDEMVHEAFENSKKYSDHLLDANGFLSAIKELKSGVGVDMAKLDALGELVDEAQRRTDDASLIHHKLDNARGQMRTFMLARKLKLAEGDTLVKKAQMLNFKGLEPEEEVVVLQGKMCVCVCACVCVCVCVCVCMLAHLANDLDEPMNPCWALCAPYLLSH